MKTRMSLTVFVVIALMGLIASPTSAQDLSQLFPPNEEISRAGKKLEVFGILGFFSGNSESTSTPPVIGFDYGDGFLGGFGLGTNLTDHLNLNFDATFGGIDYTTTVGGVPVGGKEEEEQFTILVNLDYNVSKTRLTPVVTAGVGLTVLDGGSSGGGPGFEETDFSYGFGAGVRWDVTYNHFFKVLYRKVWTELKGFDNAHEFDMVNFYFGVTY